MNWTRQTIMNTREMIIKLNSIKTSFGKNSFTTKELTEVLKENGFTGISMLLHGMRHCNIIKSVSSNRKDGTKFTDPGKPIYIGVFEKAIQYGHDCDKKYHNNYYQKNNNPLTPIEEAIKLLKENGYKVYKQKITFEEI